MESMFRVSEKANKTANHYTCPTCLEKNRDCVVLGKELIEILLSLGIYKYYVGERTKSNAQWPRNIVCWECHARIKNIQLFKKRAKYAQQTLSTTNEQVEPSKGLSRLKISDGRNTHNYNYNEDGSTESKKLTNTDKLVKQTNKNTTKKKISLKAKDLTTIKSAHKPVYIIVNDKNSRDGKVIIRKVTSKNLCADRKLPSTRSEAVIKRVICKNDNKTALNNKTTTIFRATTKDDAKKIEKVTRIVPNKQNENKEPDSNVRVEATKLPVDKAGNSLHVSEDTGLNITNTADNSTRGIDKFKSNPMKNIADLIKEWDVLKKQRLNKKISLVQPPEYNVLNASLVKISLAENLLNQSSHVIGGERIIYDSDDGEIEMIEEYLDTILDLTELNVDKTSTQLEKDLTIDKEPGKKSSTQRDKELDNMLNDQFSILCYDSDNDSIVTFSSTESDFNESDIDDKINEVPPNKLKEQHVIEMMKMYIKNKKLNNRDENEVVKKPCRSERLANKTDDDVIELSDDSDNVVELESDEYNDIDIGDQNKNKKKINSNSKDKHTQRTTIDHEDRDESGDTTEIYDVDDYDSDKTDDYDINNYVNQITAAQCIEKENYAKDAEFEKNKSTNVTLDVLNENVSDTVVTSTSNKDQNDIAENKENKSNDKSVENDLIIDENFEENWLNKTLDSDTQSLQDSNIENIDSVEKNIPTCTENNFTENKENENDEKEKNIAVNYASNFRLYSNKSTIIANKSIQYILVISADNVDTSTKKCPNYNSISRTENDKTALMEKASILDYENHVMDCDQIFKSASDNKTIVDAAKDEDNKVKDKSKETVTDRYSSSEESEIHYSNRIIAEDSTCCTGNDLNGNRSNILLQPDDTLNQQNKDVNEERMQYSKSINATEFEEIICIPEEKELNNVSKIQCDNKLKGQKEDLNEETMQEPKSTDASEVARNHISNNSGFNSVSKILPETMNQLNQQKENINKDITKRIYANKESNCKTDDIELNNVTGITNRTDSVMTSKEFDVNLTNKIRETLMQDICIQPSNNLVEIPSRICNKNNIETNKNIDLQIDKNLNDMLCKEKEDVKEYELTKETNAIAIRTVNHRQMMVVNRITSGAPPQVLKPVIQKSKAVNFENNVINKIRILSDTNLGKLPQIHRKSIIPSAQHRTITMPVMTPEVIHPSETELETKSETATKISVTTEAKTDSITETMCVPTMESEVIVPYERDCVTDYYLNMPLKERREPFRRLIKERTLLPLKRSHKIDQLNHLTDLERIWQEHSYAKLSFQRLKDTQRCFKNCMRYPKKILEKQISEKSKSDTDSNGENSNDIHTHDVTMTDDRMSAGDCRKKIFNVLASMQTINLNHFFPEFDATMVNLNDVINQGPIKTYKDLEAHITYESEEFLHCGEDNENASKVINIKQEPDSDISDYEHEDLEPYYACSGIFCDEEIDIKLEPMDLKSISTLSAEEDNDFEDDTFYLQDFPHEFAFTDNDQSMRNYYSNEDHIERPPKKPCNIVANTEANSNVSTDKLETDNSKEIDKVGLSSAFSDFDDDDAQELPIQNQINNILSNLEADVLEEELCADELLKPVYFIDWNGETCGVEEDMTEQANKKQTFSKKESSGQIESRLTRPKRNKKRKYSNSSRRNSSSSLQATKRKKQEKANNNIEAEKCEIVPLKKTKTKSRGQRKKNKKQRNMSIDEIYRIILGEDIKKEYVEELNKTKKNNQNSLDDSKIVLTDFIANNEVINVCEIEDMDEIGADDDDDNITLNEFETTLNKPECSTNDKENYVNECFVEKENSLLEDKSKEFIQIDLNNYLVQIPLDVIDGLSIADSKDNALIPADSTSDSNEKITNAENLNQHKSNEEKSSSLIDELKDVKEKGESTSKKKKHTRPVKRKRVLNNDNPNEETTDYIKDLSKKDNPNEETTDYIKDLSKKDNPNEETTEYIKDLSKKDNPNEETTDYIKDLSKKDNPNEETTDNIIDNPNEETPDYIKDLSKKDNPNEEKTRLKRKRIKTIDSPNKNKIKSRSKTDDSDKKTSKEVKLRARKIVFKNHMKVVVDIQELELLREREKTTERFKNADFKCESCVQIFPRCSIWKSHYVKYHCETNCHTCRICDCKFARKRLLMMHLEGHRRCFKCLYCDNKYFHLESLNEHLRQSNHDGQSKDQTISLKCHRCDAQFTTASKLNRHFRTQHKEESFYSIYKIKNRPCHTKNKKTTDVKHLSENDATSSKELMVSNDDMKLKHDEMQTTDAVSNGNLASKNNMSNDVMSAQNLMSKDDIVESADNTASTFRTLKKQRRLRK